MSDRDIHRERADLVEVRSPNRPFTRAMKTALREDHGALEFLEPNGDMGRGEGALLPERPPEAFLEANELRVVDDPDVIFELDSGRTVAVYTDPERVVSDGVESSVSPEDAVAEARAQGWAVIAGDPEAVTEAGDEGESDE